MLGGFLAINDLYSALWIKAVLRWINAVAGTEMSGEGMNRRIA
jgi:cytochrome bd-type quinol oxidase subunit 1